MRRASRARCRARRATSHRARAGRSSSAIAASARSRASCRTWAPATALAAASAAALADTRARGPAWLQASTRPEARDELVRRALGSKTSIRLTSSRASGARPGTDSARSLPRNCGIALCQSWCLLRPGQVASVGVPSRRNVLKSWSCEVRRRARLANARSPSRPGRAAGPKPSRR